MWGSMLSQRFRGASLLTLFRGALSQAFVPSYFPFATLCRLSPCFCLNHVWNAIPLISRWSPPSLTVKTPKTFQLVTDASGNPHDPLQLGVEAPQRAPQQRRQAPGRARQRAHGAQQAAQAGDMARERVHGFSGENLPPFMVVHLLEWWSWDINDISKHIKPIIKDINYYDKSPSIIIMETHKRFVVHPKR